MMLLEIIADIIEAILIFIGAIITTVVIVGVLTLLSPFLLVTLIYLSIQDRVEGHKITESQKEKE